jgi:glycosyltransferase involved in cell wall biosynthesis
MKTLVITNLAPTVSNPNSGIFVVRRLQHYKSFGVDFDTISLGQTDSKMVTAIKKLLRRTSYKPLEKCEEVIFKPILIHRNFHTVLMNKISRSYFVKIAEQFVRAIEQSFDLREYDLIHAHGMYDVPAGLIAKILAEKYGKPFVITLHGSDVNILMPRRKEIYVNVLEKASATIFVSRALLERAKSMGFSGKNAVVIPNGYDETIFIPMNKERTTNTWALWEISYQ